MGFYLFIVIHNNYFYFVNKLVVLVFIYMNYSYLTNLVIYYYVLYYTWLQVQLLLNIININVINY